MCAKIIKIVGIAFNSNTNYYVIFSPHTPRQACACRVKLKESCDNDFATVRDRFRALAKNYITMANDSTGSVNVVTKVTTSVKSVNFAVFNREFVDKNTGIVERRPIESVIIVTDSTFDGYDKYRNETTTDRFSLSTASVVRQLSHLSVDAQIIANNAVEQKFNADGIAYNSYADAIRLMLQNAKIVIERQHINANESYTDDNGISKVAGQAIYVTTIVGIEFADDVKQNIAFAKQQLFMQMFCKR